MYQRERVHIGLVRPKKTTFVRALSIGGLLFATVVFFFVPNPLLVLCILALNTLLETYKRFAPMLPLELELLYAGTLYFALQSVAATLAIVFLGPLTVELAHLQSSREIVSRTAGLLTAALLAFALPHTTISIAIALIGGLALHFVLAGVLYGTFGMQNWLRRISTAVFVSYLLFVFG